MQQKTTWHAASMLIAGVVSTGCASSVATRSFERPEARQVPLKSLDVVVVGGTPQSTTRRFDVDAFAPPSLDQTLLEKPEDPSVRDSLVNAARRVLGALGYEKLRFITADSGPAARDDAGSAPSVLPMRPVETASSSTVTTSTTGARLPEIVAVPPTNMPARPLPDALRLSPDTTLEAVLARSSADAVLVLRAVPVDQFGVLVEDEDTVGLQQDVGLIQTISFETRNGRLLVGQAFLFTRSGARLWSRQAPDFPDAGRLTYGHPFLKSGVVLKQGSTLPPAKLAQISAERFMAQLLRELPPSTPGDPKALERIEARGLKDAPLQEFFDQPHLAFELDFGWGLETSELSRSFQGEPLGAMKEGELTPAGVFRLTPRVNYWTPSKLIWSLSVPIGFSPGGSGSTLYRDDDLSTTDNIGTLRAGDLISGGLEVELGRPISLAENSPTLFLIPRGGVFADAWFFQTESSGDASLGESTRVRMGVKGGLDLIYRPAVEGPMFLRIGLDGRLGGDFAGGIVAGFSGGLGIGVLL